MSKDKEILKDEKDLEVTETVEETTEEVVTEEKEETTEEAETEEKEETTEEAETEEKEESTEEAETKEKEESAEEVVTEEKEESAEEAEEAEEVVELTEEELAAIEEEKAVKAAAKKKMIKGLVGGAALIAAIAGGTYVYSGYQTDFTMPEYVGLEIEDIAAIEVTDEYFESELEMIVQYTNASVEVDRAAKDGDIVDIDYAGSIEGEYFDGGTAEGYELLLGSGSFIDTFEEQLEGSIAGEEVEVVVSFPEDYYSEELAGQEAIFEVTVNAVKEKIANELTDEFVKAVSEESTTVAEYRDEIRAMLEEQSEESRLYGLKSAAWNLLVESIEVTVYPKFKITEISKEIYTVIEAQADEYGMALSDYVASAGYDDESFATYVEEVAQEQYRVKTTVDTIIKTEGLGLSDEEMTERIEEILVLMGLPDIETAIEAGYTMDDLELNVLVEVVVEYLVEVATLVEAAPMEELSLDDIVIEME